ncbi:MAG: hypothetical protein M0Q48_05855 [Verrucomicrobia bacterium]|jgi:hypothetical protein|nr:hypothetical protein [Verrucomicrobiota bacterium]
MSIEKEENHECTQMGSDVLGWVVRGTVQNKTAKIGAKQQTLQQITCIVTESTSQIPVYLRKSASSAVKTFPRIISKISALF